VIAAGQRVREYSPTGRVSADYLFYPGEQLRSLGEDLRRSLSCPVHFEPQARALYAADASNYRQVPIGVVVPRNVSDVVEAVGICRRHGVPIVARGGGTAIAGQTVNVAVVIDFSRYMNAIIEIDPVRKTARVQPGCILDHLRQAAEEHHLTFGPDPATHDHNTIGGMIGNNSCGVHSVMSGRTSDYVNRLTVLTYDGELMQVGPTSGPELRKIIGGGGRRGEIYGRMVEFRDTYGKLIEKNFPDIPRRVSGFENLDRLLPQADFNVAQALTGTECTCALVLEAELNLIHSPPYRALAILAFDDVASAADAVPGIMEHGPCGLEGFDHLLFQAVKESNAPPEGLRYFPDGGGWLIVEMGGDTAQEAEAGAKRVAAGFDRVRIVTDPAQQKQVWVDREASLGATAFVPGKPVTWDGWEDSAVPPDRLGDYLRDFRALMHRHGYEAAIYGHFGGGCVHCRINFEFGTEAGIARFRNFVTEAAHLVVSYGGSLSGEHGDGQSRAELLEIMYGPELVRAFAEFKAIWDPDGLMNPGKVVDPYPLDSNIRLGPDYVPPDLDSWFAYPKLGGFAQTTIHCVGVGKCRRKSVGDEVMCPSYLVTHEEKHTTRGRAHLLHEMARGELIRDGWDSAEVEDALSLCLACKGCRKDCPTGVDMATWKAEFRGHHYRNRRRPRSAWSMSHIERWARLAEHAPWLANLGIRTPGIAAVSKWVGGVDQRRTMPAFARSFRKQFRANRSGGDRVMLWADTFNNYFRPGTANAAARLLEAAGYEVVIPKDRLCCGRPLYDWGYLDEAKALWERSFKSLTETIASGIPIIGLEPACTAAFKDELVGLFPDRKEAMALSRQAIQFGDFVAENFDRFPAPKQGGSALVQAHCHHHAVIGFNTEMELLGRLGLDVERPPQGCCGMAGAFGFAVETYEVSQLIGERVLLPAVCEAPSDKLILADGFSCREQIEQGTGRATLHIAELLAERMLGQAASP
jgi:FAD/FMN-containing dehydrogenase/Fe-S oxidoreductase